MNAELLLVRRYCAADIQARGCVANAAWRPRYFHSIQIVDTVVQLVYRSMSAEWGNEASTRIVYGISWQALAVRPEQVTLVREGAARGAQETACLVAQKLFPWTFRRVNNLCVARHPSIAPGHAFGW